MPGPQLSPQALQEVQSLIAGVMKSGPAGLGGLPADFCTHWPTIKPILEAAAAIPGPAGQAAKALLLIGNLVCGMAVGGGP